jgi:hypothetical protein
MLRIIRKGKQKGQSEWSRHPDCPLLFLHRAWPGPAKGGTLEMSIFIKLLCCCLVHRDLVLQSLFKLL